MENSFHPGENQNDATIDAWPPDARVEQPLEPTRRDDKIVKPCEKYKGESGKKIKGETQN